MKKMKFFKTAAIFLSLIVFLACSDQGKKPQTEQSKTPEAEQQINIDSSDQKAGESTAIEKEANNIGMSPEEAEILDMMVTEYERNSEDLMNWSELAAKVNNVDQANMAMMEYIEVQKRFNENTKTIETHTIEILGKDHVYSQDYETTFQEYLSDPMRANRSNRTVNATMSLIDKYGSDEKFQAIMKKLEVMNRHRMKELNEDKK